MRMIIKMGAWALLSILHVSDGFIQQISYFYRSKKAAFCLSFFGLKLRGLYPFWGFSGCGSRYPDMWHVNASCGYIHLYHVSYVSDSLKLAPWLPQNRPCGKPALLRPQGQRWIAAMEESEEQVLRASPVVTRFQTPGLERLFDLWSRTSKTGRAATPGATEEQQRHESMAPRQN